MLSKYPVTKLASVLASVMLFVLLWGAIAVVGWSGGSSDATADPATVAVPAVATPAPTPAPPVTIRRTVVVRRIHESGAGTGATAAPPPPSAPPPAAAPAPAGPPPQPAPVPAPKANPAPVTKTRGS